MYARILRKWSLKTKLQMSLLMWLTLVTMLLLCVCAPTATCADAMREPHAPASTSAPPRLPSQPQMLPVQQEQQPQLPPATNVYTSAVDETWQQPASVGATIEESYYIPVDVAGDSSNFASNIYNSRLISKLGGSSRGSSSSSSSSSSKLFSSSKLSSISEQSQQQQQQHLEATSAERHMPDSEAAEAATYADSLAYSYYYKAAQQRQQQSQVPAALMAAVITPTTTATAPTSAVFKQQFGDNEHDVDDNDDDDDDDMEEDEDEQENVDIDAMLDVEEDTEDDLGDEDDVRVATDFGNVAATLKETQKVPNVKNSHIINLFHNYHYINDKQQAQQRQQAQVAAAAEAAMQQEAQHVGNVRSVKARRHITEQQQQQQHNHHLRQHQLHIQQQLQLQQQQQSTISAATPTLQQQPPQQNYHNPVRENVAGSQVEQGTKVIHFANGKNITLKMLPPTHLRIEAYEIPSSLPYGSELSEQQLRLYQQHQLQQQQAARNRRDSRNFAVKQGALLGSGSNIVTAGGFRHSIMQSPQQPTQQQGFQRLQQYSNANLNNDNNNNIFQRQQPTAIANTQRQQHNHPQQHQHQHQHQRQRQHQHQNHQRRQNQQRRHARRYCSARDPAQLAFEAPQVFEGKVTSMSQDRRHNFSASVQVLHVYKQQIGFMRQQFIRLQFAYINGSGECDIYREQLRPLGLVNRNVLEQQRIYLFFVQQINSRNFTILGQPIRKTRRVVEAVERAVSENYAQLASITSITTNTTQVEIGKELRIVCKVRGRPPPKVTWFKDGKSINGRSSNGKSSNRKLYHFRHYKKRSELIINSFNKSDAGQYECRAKNKVNRTLKNRTIRIEASPVPRYETTSTGGAGDDCPIDAAEYCYNGGTCRFFTDIGTYSCTCPEGFGGERCTQKEVNNIPPSTYSNNQNCGETYFGSFYC